MSRRRRTEEEVNTPTNNHPLQQQQRIPPSFSLSTLKRWRKHILFVGLFKDTSRVLRDGRDAITPALMSTWFIVIFGILLGGNGINFVYYITKKLMDFAPMWLDSILLMIVILAGPDFLPPLTPMNGCEYIKNRIIWSFLYFGHYWLMNIHYLPDGSTNKSELGENQVDEEKLVSYILALSSFQIFSIISGIWHMDQGDYFYRKTQHNFHNYFRSRGISPNDNELIDASRYLMMYQFEAACGIGIFWATFEIYSTTVFIYVFIGFFVMNICISVYGRIQGIV
jgi:hypothetical protein